MPAINAKQSATGARRRASTAYDSDWSVLSTDQTKSGTIKKSTMHLNLKLSQNQNKIRQRLLLNRQ